MGLDAPDLPLLRSVSKVPGGKSRRLVWIMRRNSKQEMQEDRKYRSITHILL